MSGNLLLIYICNFHVLSNLLLIYICKLHWNLKCHIPALFVAAEGDTFVPSHHSKKIYEKYAGDKNLVIVDGDHNSVRPKFLYDSVSSFLIHVLQVCNHPDLSQLNPDLSQLNPNLSQHNPNLSQFNPDLSQLNPNLS